jgi:hypothetical protein
LRAVSHCSLVPAFSAYLKGKAGVACEVMSATVIAIAVTLYAIALGLANVVDQSGEIVL